MTTHPDRSPQRSELQDLRKELRRRHDYVEDDKTLWWEISLFLEQTATHHDGSVRTLVKRRLAELQQDPKHKMYPHRGVDAREEAFPDDCDGCPHYGVQCPVVTRKSVTDRLDRLFEQYEGDQLVSELLDIANQHNCHVLKEVLTNYDQDERQYLAKGQELYRRAVQHSSDSDAADLDLNAETMEELGIDLAEFGLDEDDLDDADGLPTSSGAGGRTSPPPEVAEKVEDVSATVRGESDDEDEEGRR
jgi:hypothetical protein